MSELKLIDPLPYSQDSIISFFGSIHKTRTCWVWLRNTCSIGYGTFILDGKKFLAHRFSYEIHKGPIPKGLLVCHSCDNPFCVNPEHLWVGSYQDNTRDAYAKGRMKPYAHAARKIFAGPVNPRKRALRAKMAELGFTYSDLAATLTKLSGQNVCLSHIGHIAHGRRKATRLLPYLAQALNLSVEQLTQLLNS